MLASVVSPKAELTAQTSNYCSLCSLQVMDTEQRTIDQTWLAKDYLRESVCTSNSERSDREMKYVCISIRVESAIELCAHTGKIPVSGVMSCSGVYRPSPVVELLSFVSMLV